ncbi:hypothetical protein [Enterobacter phage 02_vB_Eclo_IJM]|nr:hypothetical protein [Enterobacter phage 02_vB_Eclo_IJM]
MGDSCLTLGFKLVDASGLELRCLGTERLRSMVVNTRRLWSKVTSTGPMRSTPG